LVRGRISCTGEKIKKENCVRGIILRSIIFILSILDELKLFVLKNMYANHVINATCILLYLSIQELFLGELFQAFISLAQN
jgi:hypothetical protein